MIIAPCRFCEKRELGCRSNCDSWQEYQTKKNEEYEARTKRFNDRNAWFGNVDRRDREARRKGLKRYGKF